MNIYPTQSILLNATTFVTYPPPSFDLLGTSLHGNDHPAIVGANILIGVLGILGNATVIVVYLMNPKMARSVTSLYIFHQSFIDLASSVIFLAVRLDTWRPLLHRGVASIACRLWYSEYLLWVIVMTSTLNLLLVSMERYVSIAHLVFHRNNMTRRKAKVSMLLAWAFSLAYQSYWAVVSTAADGKCEPLWGSDGMQTFFGIMTFLVEYLIPLVLMTFAYASIVSRLHQRSRVSALYEVRWGVSKDTSGRNTSELELPTRAPTPTPKSPTLNRPRSCMFSEAKRNVFKTLCIVFATYVICWTPTELEYLVYNLGGPLDFNGPFHRITVILVLCNMCVNPIIYALKYREFQHSLKRLLANCCDRLRLGQRVKNGSETEQFGLSKLENSPLPPKWHPVPAVNLAVEL